MGVIFGGNDASKLWQHLTLKDNIELTQKIYKVVSQNHNTVKQFGLEKLLNKPISKMSLGQKTKCELALTMLPSPVC